MERKLRDLLPQGRFADVEKRHRRIIQSVRSTGNRSTERKLRMALVGAGVSGWAMHPPNVEGKPDVFFPNEKLAIFTDGCYWHGCPHCGHQPKKSSGYWSAKVAGNRARDQRRTEALRAAGMEVLRFWEHELDESLGRCLQQVRQALTKQGRPKR